MTEPRLITFEPDGDDLVLMGDGVPLVRFTRRSGLWVIARIAEALARSA